MAENRNFFVRFIFVLAVLAVHEASREDDVHEAALVAHEDVLVAHEEAVPAVVLEEVLQGLLWVQLGD